MTDTEFADMFDYDNITEKEVQERKSELKEAYISCLKLLDISIYLSFSIIKVLQYF